MDSLEIADPSVTKSPATPSGIQRFNAQYRQNVAVLWLKCGVKSQKIEPFWAREILWLDATIC